MLERALQGQKIMGKYNKHELFFKYELYIVWDEQHNRNWSSFKMPIYGAERSIAEATHVSCFLK